MQNIANTSAETVENLNKESMKTIRKDLYAENEICYFAGADVRIEADGLYSNPLFAGGPISRWHTSDLQYV